MNSNYTLVAGKNIFSLFLALKYSSMGKSLYFIDDPKVNTGRRSREYFSSFEIKLLEVLGKHRKIASFCDVSKFVTSEKIEFIQVNSQESKHLILTDDYQDNYNELLRHSLIPEYEGDFFNDFSLYLNALSEKIVLNPNNSFSLDRGDFSVPGHQRIVSFIDQISSNWLSLVNEKSWHIQTLIEQFCAFFSFRFYSRYTKTELMFLILSAFSGVSKMDYLKCELELGKELESNNAISRIAEIIDCDTDKKEIVSAMLSTHDGVININKVFLFGSRPSFGSPLELSKNNYLGWRSFDKRICLENCEEKVVIISSFRDMSEDIPIRYYYIDSNGETQMSCFIRYLPASKESFFVKQVDDILKNDLESFFYSSVRTVTSNSFSWGNDYLFLQSPQRGDKPSIPLKLSSTPYTELSLDSACYLGDFNENANGVVSQLMRANYV